uniref:Uncharacterized protein n=1 Tax=Arundo donax TaxID=35708 RepID=A0A0A8ZNL2_ARUDO
MLLSFSCYYYYLVVFLFFFVLVIWLEGVLSLI